MKNGIMAVRMGAVIFLCFSPGLHAQIFPGPVPGMEFVELPGGDFEYVRIEDEFGNVVSSGDSIHIRSFQIMTTEVTQAMWEHVMGIDVDVYLDSAGVSSVGPDYPMCMVSLEDCIAFVDSLSSLDSLYLYRIPSDHFWSYACAAGTYTPFPWGTDTLDIMAAHCWYSGNAGNSLHPVASLFPDQWHLYDVCGNVFEWTTVSGGVEFEDPETGRTVTGQVLRGGSVYSSAMHCRRDYWLRSDPGAEYSDVGFRVIRRLRSDGWEDMGPSRSQVLDSLLHEDRFAVFVEPMLAVGGISHDFYEDDMEQFGYDVKSGCEQDAAYIRAGLGKHFGRFGAFVYGEVGHIGPGSLIDNHGPWILPEVLLRMNVLAGGVELRYFPARIRFGYGSYSGHAEIDNDTAGAPFPGGSWSTDIVDGRGFSFGVGVHIPVSEYVAGGVEWSQHFIDLKLAESGTGVEPSEHTARQYEVRFFVNFQLPFKWSSIF